MNFSAVLSLDLCDVNKDICEFFFHIFCNIILVYQAFQ